jgi:hypothetical protein
MKYRTSDEEIWIRARSKLVREAAAGGEDLQLKR